MTLAKEDGTVIDISRLAKRFKSPGEAWALKTRPGIQILDFPTAQVRVRIAGQGKKTIVFALDPPNVVELYDEIFEILSPDYRVICFEQPGFGFSYPKVGFDFSHKAFAQILESLLQELNVGPYVLAFPCFSVYYALEVAKKRPDLIEKLVLMQASSWKDQKKWVKKVANIFTFVTLGIPFFGDKLMSIPYVGQVFGMIMEPIFVQRTAPFVAYRGFLNRKLVAKFVKPIKEAVTHGACNCLQSLRQKFFEEGEMDSFQLSQPTLLLWTSADLSHARSNKTGLREYAPHAEFKEISKTGHHFELEDPQRVCKAIKEFVPF